METATFAAGCFWGPEEAFRRIDGVVDTSVGYTGGTTADPTYRDICGGRTGHAEAVRVTFDAARISYDELLELFFSIHDPTQLNRQGPDIGDQYRSAIFVHGPEQEAAARAARERLTASGRFPRPIVTEIVAAGTVTMAEDNHQRFFEKRARAQSAN